MSEIPFVYFTPVALALETDSKVFKTDVKEFNIAVLFSLAILWFQVKTLHLGL